MKSYDVIVIGSGFGGAVSSATMAQAGMKVCVLEKGTWWGKSQGNKPFPESPVSTLRSVRSVHLSASKRKMNLTMNRRGLIEFHNLSGLNVVAGVGVGGSSLVYGGLSQRPPDYFFDSFPAEVTRSEMEPHYRSVEEVLQPSACPQPTDRSLHTLKLAAELERREAWNPEIAITWGEGPEAEQSIENPWGVRQANCDYCARCLPGCNRGAKNSLDLNFIAQARSGNAEIMDLCEVQGIRKVGAKYQVDYRDMRTKRHHCVTAPKVVLAAGTLNTHKLLFSSRDSADGLPNLSPMLGKRFSSGGDTIMLYPKRDFQFNYGHGPLVETAVESFDEENRTEYFVVVAGNIFMDSLLVRPGRKMLNRTLLMAGFGRDDGNGELNWDGRDLTLSMPDQKIIGKIYSTMHLLARGYGQTGSGLPICPKDANIRPRKPLFTAHPMGGCRMGDTPEAGVVDHRGEAFGYPGLYIADASILCGPPVCAPSLTIASMAHRISDIIVASERGN